MPVMRYDYHDRKYAREKIREQVREKIGISRKGVRPCITAILCSIFSLPGGKQAGQDLGPRAVPQRQQLHVRAVRVLIGSGQRLQRGIDGGAVVPLGRRLAGCSPRGCKRLSVTQC